MNIISVLSFQVPWLMGNFLLDFIRWTLREIFADSLQFVDALKVSDFLPN